MTQELQDYVKTSRAQGLSDNQIRQNLKHAGWTNNQIDPWLQTTSSTLIPKSVSVKRVVILFVALTLGPIILVGLIVSFYSGTIDLARPLQCELSGGDWQCRDGCINSPGHVTLEYRSPRCACPEGTVLSGYKCISTAHSQQPEPQVRTPQMFAETPTRITDEGCSEIRECYNGAYFAKGNLETCDRAQKCPEIVIPDESTSEDVERIFSQVYTNDRNAYQFKYPNYYLLGFGTRGETTLLNGSNAHEVNIQPDSIKVNGKLYGWMVIDVVNGTDAFSTYDFMKCAPEQQCITESVSTEIFGKDIQGTRSISTSSKGSNASYEERFDFQHNGDNWSVSILFFPGTPKRYRDVHVWTMKEILKTMQDML